MDDNDLVDLIIVTKESNFMGIVSTRRYAADFIKVWFDERERVRNLPWWRILWRQLCAFPNWQRPYTYVLNAIGSSSKCYGFWAIDVRYIVGMYTRERGNSAYDRLAEAQNKIADAMYGEMKKGEEWRDGVDDDGDED